MPKPADRKTESDTFVGGTFLPAFLSTCAAFALAAFFLPEISPEIKQPASPETLANLTNRHFDGLDEIADYTPLFLTTKWNAAPAPRPAPAPRGWNFTKTNLAPPALALSDAKFLTSDGDDFERGRTELAQSITGKSFSSFRRSDSPATAVKPTGFTFKLVDMNSGATVKTAPVEMPSDGRLYAVAEFKVYVERDGWAMKPLELQSSGDDSRDAELAAMLTSSKLLKGTPHGEYKAVFIP